MLPPLPIVDRGGRPHAYSVPACWFFSTAVIMRVAVVL
jgi:hypothetical protein